jgi:O-antigen ligase
MHADAAAAPVPSVTPLSDWLERAGLFLLFGLVACVQFSIAAAESLLLLTTICWLSLLIVRHERVEAPRFFPILLVYGGWTLVSAAFSLYPRESFIESKQLVLLLLVPLVYRFAAGGRARALITLTISVGAASALIGIFEYSILRQGNAPSFLLKFLGVNTGRASGTVGHYMTYSGLLMLVFCAALARVLFDKRDRLWPALVIPGLAAAITFTFTRSATVGVCAGTAALLLLKDFRLIALLPIAVAVFFALAPADVTQRLMSMFDASDPTRRDRIAMMRSGVHIIRDHPLTGLGPDMIRVRYAEYRDPMAVQAINPHLHNVPLQIAAERGLPALAVWVTFIVVVVRDLLRLMRTEPAVRSLAATALAAIVAMLMAGMFEYNYGDSEFLMLLLTLVTLPFAALRPAPSEPPHA